MLKKEKKEETTKGSIQKIAAKKEEKKEVVSKQKGFYWKGKTKHNGKLYEKDELCKLSESDVKVLLKNGVVYEVK